MQWADVTKPPSPRTLKQFGALCLVVFGGLAVWRMAHGQWGPATRTLSALSVGLGGLGLVRPMLLRWVYSGWMMVAFPIGWTVSRVMVGAMFFLVFTPVAVVFRVIGRDALGRRRRREGSYWTEKTGASSVDEYFRQV